MLTPRSGLQHLHLYDPNPMSRMMSSREDVCCFTPHISLFLSPCMLMKSKLTFSWKFNPYVEFMLLKYCTIHVAFMFDHGHIPFFQLTPSFGNPAPGSDATGGRRPGATGRSLAHSGRWKAGSATRAARRQVGDRR